MTTPATPGPIAGYFKPLFAAITGGDDTVTADQLRVTSAVALVGGVALGSTVARKRVANGAPPIAGVFF